MRRFLLATSAVTALAFAPVLAETAHADVILAFGQSGGVNTVTGTLSGSTTTITADTGVFVTSYAGTTNPPFAAYIKLNMTSTGSATNNAGTDQQTYSGTFDITSGFDDTGINYLSGSFTGLLSGAAGGTALSFSSSGTVTFSSDQISGNNLQAPQAVSFGFTNVTPVVGITSNSLNSFTSSISGNMSSNYVAPPPPPPPPPPPGVPEPASLLLLSGGLIGLGAVRRSRSRSN